MVQRAVKLANGDRIGAYRIVGHLVGNTYRGVHIGNPPRRVLIELAPLTNWRETSVQMLRTQRLVESLQHPGIARIVELGMLADRTPWMAVEVPSGIALYELVGRRVMSAPDTAALIRDTADVLAYTHSLGVVHGALSLRSIILRTGVPVLRAPAEPGLAGILATGARSHPLVIADWGLIVDQLDVFFAPELAAGGAFDGRADVYSLGMIAFRAATGMFPGHRGVLDVPGVPTGLATLIARMLALDPEERPTAADVHAIANGLVVDEDIDTAPMARVDAVPESASAADSARYGDDVVHPGGPRIGRPRWTPSPELPITSDRAPTASGEIRKKPS
jgi:serine/threonine protein kinase